MTVLPGYEKTKVVPTLRRKIELWNGGDFSCIEDPEAKASVARVIERTLDPSGQSSNRTATTHLIVSGKLIEKGITYPVEWDIPLTESEIKAFDEELKNIARITSRSFRTPDPNLEIFSDISESVRIGYAERQAKNHAYLEVRKGSETLKIRFTNLLQLNEVYSSLKQLESFTQ